MDLPPLRFVGLDERVLWSMASPGEAAEMLSAPSEGWLAPVERETLGALQAEARRREWCAGRLAVKRTVQCWMERRGRQVSLGEIAITQDAQGAPHVTLPGGWEAPRVSIAHTAGYGIAALAPPEMGVWVGVDIERVRDLRPEFLTRMLSPGEPGCATVQPPGAEALDAVTLWTLKEATVKALGLGLRLPMRCLFVAPGAPGTVTIARVPGPPDADDHAVRPWAAWGFYGRCGELTAAIVLLRRDPDPVNLPGTTPASGSRR